MAEFDPEAYRQMVRSYQEREDPLGWFDSIYSSANGDHTAVFWADLAPNPYLTGWLKAHPLDKGEKKKAIAVGCGVGDDAEELSAFGYDVTAFDIAPSAIALCKNRYPDSKVEYLIADLFDYPEAWRGAYDVVYECNTIQVLPGKYRIMARDAMVSLLTPGGTILVSCRSRLAGEQTDAIPLPLDRDEIGGFVRAGLNEESFVAYDDDQTPPVPHFFATYRKPL
ncbi:class I SAM-dependent methyltransferase [Sulfurimonas sp. HSL-3221]|uniref:class I SAM-dependent methyltransferase n=1 Tax=Thiomicrolovo sulfuroxydans TaxID=2894755 RepID=UPI001E4768C0|nr:class I SAM-dependent methyltransferase [Sulfurimonas sp. HSL-3221]UFS61420.1 class I SAM-dependent methyltransferase [Sulfurimonas sp. HSL-3221]